MSCGTFEFATSSFNATSLPVSKSFARRTTLKEPEPSWWCNSNRPSATMSPSVRSSASPDSSASATLEAFAVAFATSSAVLCFAAASRSRTGGGSSTPAPAVAAAAASTPFASPGRSSSSSSSSSSSAPFSFSAQPVAATVSAAGLLGALPPDGCLKRRSTDVASKVFCARPTSGIMYSMVSLIAMPMWHSTTTPSSQLPLVLLHTCTLSSTLGT
mmetsp:Transcript_52309/g.149895  ORF Transcript_52309/g.149895 Transcript_52309/m.149895 type:complete len:215 (+) Transcript_52309:879-1523(+)